MLRFLKNKPKHSHPSLLTQTPKPLKVLRWKTATCSATRPSPRKACLSESRWKMARWSPKASQTHDVHLVPFSLKLREKPFLSVTEYVYAPKNVSTNHLPLYPIPKAVAVQVSFHDYLTCFCLLLIVTDFGPKALLQSKPININVFQSLILPICAFHPWMQYNSEYTAETTEIILYMDTFIHSIGIPNIFSTGLYHIGRYGPCTLDFYFLWSLRPPSWKATHKDQYI